MAPPKSVASMATPKSLVEPESVRRSERLQRQTSRQKSTRKATSSAPKASSRSQQNRSDVAQRSRVSTQSRRDTDVVPPSDNTQVPIPSANPPINTTQVAIPSAGSNKATPKQPTSLQTRIETLLTKVDRQGDQLQALNDETSAMKRQAKITNAQLLAHSVLLFGILLIAVVLLWEYFCRLPWSRINDEYMGIRRNATKREGKKL